MKKIKEIGIPVLIWMFFIPQSVIAGIDFASMEIEPSDGMPLGFRIIVLSISFTMFFIITLINYLRPKMKFEIILERMLSKESFEIIRKRIKPYLLGSLFFGLFGITGLIKCYFVDAPEINRHILQAPLIAGIGILLGGLLAISIKRNKKESA